MKKLTQRRKDTKTQRSWLNCTVFEPGNRGLRPLSAGGLQNSGSLDRLSGPTLYFAVSLALFSKRDTSHPVRRKGRSPQPKGR